MLSSLTTARHSLFESAGANMHALNAKLERAVSRVPERHARPEEEEEGDGSDTDSVSSDGARFFRRSAGTQTSPRLSRSDSSSTSSGSDKAPPLSPAEDHAAALLRIQGRLSQLLPTANSASSNPLGDSVSELRAYLEKLPHAGSTHLGGKTGGRGEIDAVANVKAEIRGVKGVLLSARNFPSGVAAR